MSEKQSKMIYAKLMNAGLTVQQLMDEFDVSGTDQVPANRVNDVLQWIESYDWGS